MSRFKLIAFIALITLAFGVSLVADALAGEKMKGRTVKYTVKWESVDVGDEEGHVVAVYEHRGVQSILEGRKSADGAVLREVGLLDMNMKSLTGSGFGYGDLTDKDGDKYSFTWKGGTTEPKLWEGEFTVVNGTGKYDGMRGKATYVNRPAAPNLRYVDWELTLE
jgi:hypothetical protein